MPGLLPGVVSPGSDFPSLRTSDNMASFASVFDFDREANIPIVIIWASIISL